VVLKELALVPLAAAVPAAALAQAGAPETLTRTGSWVVNYDRDACHLLAQFGTGPDMLIMRLTRYRPGDPFDFSLYGRKLADSDPRSRATLDFGLGGAPAEMEAMNGKAGTTPLMLFGATRLDGLYRKEQGEHAAPVSPQQEAAVTGVTVKIGGKKPFRLQFGSLGQPMAQLRACQDDLVKSWGYDPAVQASLSRRVQATNGAGSWLRSSDYPPGAVAMGQNGMVQFRLDVDADGKITGCHVLARTSPDVFADTTCRSVARRAKLKPALDAAGNPVRSFYIQYVRWQVAE
jgi:TonB family protein